jgi:transposase
MNGHRNAKLGLAGRRALVLAIERGMTLKAAAAAFSVAAATVHRWWHRWRKASPIECRTLPGRRSSRPPYVDARDRAGRRVVVGRNALALLNRADVNGFKWLAAPE